MAADTGFPLIEQDPPAPPEDMKAVTRHLWDVARYLLELAAVATRAARGMLNCTGTVTLTASSTTTTLSDQRISARSRIFFFPTTSTAATAYGAGSMYVSAKTSGSATITHSNTADTDRVFDYAILGG